VNVTSQDSIASGSFRFRNVPDSLPRPLGYVSDFENILTPAEEKTLDSIVVDFEKATSIEIAIVTVDSTSLIKKNLYDFSLQLANAWGVGKRDKNNGVLLAICSGLGGFYIQNGLGIAPILSNEETASIIDASFYPSFRKKEYFNGLKNGLQTLTAILVNNSARLNKNR
jgi:uncharacterized protein